MFTYGPSDLSDESRHTGGRDLQLQPSAGIEVPSCHTMVDTHASGQGNLSAHRYSRGGSRYAPRETVYHRENSPVYSVVVERQGPDQLPGLQETLYNHERYLAQLREDVDYEYDRRHDLMSTVRRLRTDREKDRSDFAFTQLEN